jgi:hypothetical protein
MQTPSDTKFAAANGMIGMPEETVPEWNYNLEAGKPKEIGNGGLAYQSVRHKGH